jgi:hypothetical protein
MRPLFPHLVFTTFFIMGFGYDERPRVSREKAEGKRQNQPILPSAFCVISEGA